MSDKKPGEPENFPGFFVTCLTIISEQINSDNRAQDLYWHNHRNNAAGFRQCHLCTTIRP